MTQVNLNLLKSVAIAAGKEITRYYLNGVQIEIGQSGYVLVATDGHRLIAARQDAEPTQDPCSVIIPLDFINGLKINKSTDFAKLTIEGSLIKIEYCGATYTHQSIDGTYPDWRRIVPTEVDNQVAQFNPAYLNDFAKSMKMAGSSSSKAPLPIINHNGQNAALVELGCIENGDWLGVIMPTRESTYRALPKTTWVK